MPAPTIQGVPTSITAFVAPAPQGPLNSPIEIASVVDFEQSFGGIAAAGALGSAVSLFFANGGSSARVVRVNAGTPPSIADYGDPVAGTGIYSLDTVEILNLLCLPAVSDHPPLYAIYAVAAAYCEKRRALLLLDLPRNSSVADAQHWMATTGAGIRSRNAAAYYPGLLVPGAGGGGPAPVSCAGAVAGVFAREDTTRGVWRAPAGTGATIAGALGLERDLTDGDAALLSALALNCLRSFPGTGTVIWGDRTMVGQDGGVDDYKYVPIRRFALFLEQSIQEGTRWAVFEANGPALWGQIAASVTAFLQQLFTQGAFAGPTPGQSFFVRCDNTTMSEADLEAGVVNILVGFAPLHPSEFVILTIRQVIQP